MSTSALSTYAHPMAHVEKSNIPQEKKTAIREYWDGLHTRLGAIGGAGVAGGVVAATAKEGGLVLRDEAVSAITGISLALIEHTFGGLDIKAFGVAVPVDGLLAGAGAAAALASPHFGISELSPVFRTAASSATAVLAYRKGKDHFQRSGTPSLSGGKSLKELAEKLGV